MKKITSINPISFRVDGSTLLEIDSEGCLATDAAAQIALERLGEHITVEEASNEPEDKEEIELEDLSKQDLIDKATELGLDTSGTKPVLVARIKEHLEAKEEAPTEPSEDDAPVVD